MKKIISVLLLMCLGLAFMLKNADAWTLSARDLRSFDKQGGQLGDEIVRGIDSNILIVVDQSNNMVMSMRGQMPVFRWTTTASGALGLTPDDTWMQAHQPDMRNAHFRASLNAQNTFGIGSRPLSTGTIAENDNRRNNINPPSGQMFMPPSTGTERAHRDNNRWGRDIHAENNIIGCRNSYYTPDPNRPFLLTFRDERWANARFDRSNPPAGFPAALIPHLPIKDADGNVIEYGPPVPLFLANQHLVPNDSRMYKLKLVLWRLLSPEQDNLNLLSRMRLGLATTYMESRLAPTNITATSTRLVSIFSNIGLNAAGVWSGIGTGSQGNTWHPNPNNPNAITRQSISHPHGTADGLVQGRSTTSIHELPPSGISRSISTGGVPQSLRTHTLGARTAGRLQLRVPFDFMYNRGEDGVFEPTQSLMAFRELIDGIEQQATAGATGVNNRFVNMELTPHALMVSPERAMFGRDGWLANPGQVGSLPTRGSGGANMIGGSGNAVVYYAGPRDTTSFIANAGDTSSGVIMRRVQTSEGFMAGTALGDVLDFFTPNPILPFQEGGANGINDTRGFFPVTGPCQNNWVIYFSTGSEEFPGTNGEEGSMMRALMNIYEHSQVMRGRRWNGTDWEYAHFDMDRGIRTLVVGLVSTAGIENDGQPNPGDDETMRMTRNIRNNIRRMAQAGQPIRNHLGVLIPDTNVQPIFAENTQDLLAGLFEALYGIQSTSMASGAPAIPEDVMVDGMSAVFSTSYVVQTGRQWRGSLYKRLMQSNRGPDGEILPAYPAPEWIARGGGLGADAGQIMMHQAATRHQRLWTSNGGNITRVRDLSVAQMRSLFGISSLHPDEVALEFREWLINYEGDSSGILGDTENSVPIVVTSTATHYENGGLTPRPIIYLHTNRGVLHAIDVDTGEEIWGFIPPIAQNPMVRDKRFLRGGQEFIQANNMEMRSRAIRILDGALTHRNVTLPGISNRTLMVGALGLGNPGFYIMDITNPNQTQPNFLWAIANPRYSQSTSTSDIMRWGAAGNLANTGLFEHYTYLGFTVAQPAIRRIAASGGTSYVGIMPAGLGYRHTDTQGRAIFVFGLEDGGLLRTMRETSGFIQPPNLSAWQARMGMAVAPLSFINVDGNDNNNDSPLREFFTSDSEGNILHSGILSDTPVGDWSVRPIFRARNLEQVGATGPNGGGPIALPLGVTLGTDQRNRITVGDQRGGWLFSASSRIEGPGVDQDLRNNENYIFALNLANHPVFSQGDTTTAPFSLYHLGNIRREGAPFDDSGPFTGANARGWRIRLRQSVPGTYPTEAEYASVAPFLFRGELWVATFTPHAWLPGGDRERCHASGTGRLYRLNAETAAPRWGSGAQYLAFENVKIVGISIHDETLFLAVAEAAPGAAENAFGNHPAPDVSSFQNVAPGLYALGIDDLPRPEGDVSVEPGILFWREVIYR